MIDSTGKKIPDSDESVDYDFLYKEMMFFCKDVSEQGMTDSLALIVAKILNQYIDCGRYYNAETVYKILDNYSSQSNSDDFLWEFVYIDRKYKKGIKYSAEKSAAYALHAAKMFNGICRVRPSLHNKYAATLEHIVAAEAYGKLYGDYNQKIVQIYLDAEKIVESISDSDRESPKYLEAAYELYKAMAYFFDGHPGLGYDKYEYMYKLAPISMKYYDKVNNKYEKESILLVACVIYSVLLSYDKFDYENHKSNIDRILELVKNVSGQKFRDNEQKLINAIENRTKKDV